ncbi:MAG: cysteine hydrolase family protein [Sporolactobacillus sp.]
MELDKSNTCLMIIDVQKAFNHSKWGQRNNPGAEERITKLLLFWREQHLPIVHVRHSSDDSRSLFRAKSDTFDFKDEVQPRDGETIITKKVNSAFIGTHLEEILRSKHVTTLVITGLTLPHCVSTTVRMGNNLGFKIILVSDATASFPLEAPDGKIIPAEEIQQVEQTILSGEFAELLRSEEVLRIITEA